jgi:hypothetical protein
VLLLLMVVGGGHVSDEGVAAVKRRLLPLQLLQRHLSVPAMCDICIEVDGGDGDSVLASAQVAARSSDAARAACA